MRDLVHDGSVVEGKTVEQVGSLDSRLDSRPDSSRADPEVVPHSTVGTAAAQCTARERRSARGSYQQWRAQALRESPVCTAADNTIGIIHAACL